MTFLNDSERKQVQERLGLLRGPVTLLAFTRQHDCESCEDTRQLLNEVAELSDMLKTEAYDLDQNPAKGQEYDITRVPAVAIIGQRDYGIRFYGLPTGFEFSAFLDDLIDVSKGHADLGKKTRDILATLTKPIHLQVFTTPICPVCPAMVRTAHRLAIESDLIRADGVDSVEFIDEADRYGIETVPRTIINETTHLDGMIPEGKFAHDIVEAVEKP